MQLFVAEHSADGGYLLAVSIATVAAGLLLGWRELKGRGLGYSKFAQEKQEILGMLPSKLAMFLYYAPSALLAAAFLSFKLTGFPQLQSTLERSGLHNLALLVAIPASSRLLLLASVIFVHFFKRVLEVLFLHKYSGSAGVLSSVIITGLYTFAAANLLYAQQLSETLAPPAIDLLPIGVALFLIGVSGNFYHHLLLALLRSDKVTAARYLVPRGGLFHLVACPHYLFEITDFLGIAMVSQTVTSCSLFLMVAMYLTTRSLATREWYLKKVDGFPANRKALVPYLL